MPDPPPLPSDPEPDTEPDADAAFTAALYSRIRTGSPTAQVPDAPLLPLGAEEVAAQDWAMARNDHDHTLRDAPKGPVLPPAFVARVRERLQRELRAPDHGAPPVPSPTTPRSPAETRLPESPESSFKGFLERVETDLAAQYDRVLQHDLPMLTTPAIGTWCEPGNKDTVGTHATRTEATAWSDTLHARVPCTAATAFQSRYGTGLNAFCDLTTMLVADVVAGYRTFFEAEADVVAVAERYDALQTWAHQSKALFEAHADVAVTTGFDDVVAKCFGADDDAADDDALCARACAPSGTSTGTSTATRDSDPWKARVARAKRAWLDVQAQRHVVDRLRAIVGTPCTCKVCFGNVVQTVLVPCGHTLCKDCANQVGQCPFCNATFYSTQDMYLG